MASQGDMLREFAARIYTITLNMPPSEMVTCLTKVADEMEKAGIERKKEEMRQLRRLLRHKHVGA